MSHEFKLKFDQMREGDPAKPEPDESLSFDKTGSVRNVCFVWPDGKMKFLNYAYLISGSYDPEENSITLVYTTEMIFMKGVNLALLFQALFAHLPKSITCIDPRYASLEQGNGWTVLELVTQPL